MQHLALLKGGLEHRIQLPPPATEVMPGIQWGEACALFTPAYWYVQYLLRDGEETVPTKHRIGQTFPEELTACILGGYGIPAEVGLAAFYRLRQESLISDLCSDQELLERRLQEPLSVNGRLITYRFWRQKAKYLSAAFDALKAESFYTADPLALKIKLMALPGIGAKTASWVVRNWLGSN